MRGSATAYFWIYAGAALLTGLLVGLRPLNFLADDSLFYLVIGDHIARGDGSTFNGLFPTNGYHPLWELIAAALAMLAHDKASLALYGSMAQAFLMIAALWVLLRALRSYLDSPALVTFIAAMLLFFVPMGNLYWSEGPLNTFFTALVCAELLAKGPVRYVRLGVLLGLLFLSRLDSMFFIGCVIVFLWLRDRDWRIGVTCLVCAALAGVYLATNLAQYGHLLPISGAIKSAAYRGHYFVGRLGSYGVVALSGAVGLASSNLLGASRPARYRFAMLALACGTVFQCLYVAVLTEGDTAWIWYYVQGYLCVALLAAEVVTALGSSVIVLHSAGFTAFVLGLLVSGAMVAAQWSGWAWHGRQMHNAGWRSSWLADVQRAAPESDSVLIAGDQPGLFAYGTSHPVFALDGLTGNYQLDAELATRQMYGKIASFRAAYLMVSVVQPGYSLVSGTLSQVGLPGGQILHFHSPLRGADAGCIFLDNAGMLTSRPVPSSLIGGVWALWKLTPATMRQVACR
jgi:hypothetical protein